MEPFLDFNLLQWSLIALSGMLIGMSKVGVPGVSLIVIPLLAFIFGGKQSTGVLLPILMMADLIGVGYYRRHAQWSYLIKILPWAFSGILLALWIGEIVNDRQFKNLIAIVVFVCIALMIRKNPNPSEHIVPGKWWFAASMGILGGFASMIGNAAGPIFAIYILAMHLPKNNYIGTTAWFFLIINYTKFPLHLFIWKTISRQSLTLDVMILPAIILGAWLGILLVKMLPERVFRNAVIIVTTLSGFLLLF